MMELYILQRWKKKNKRQKTIRNDHCLERKSRPYWKPPCRILKQNTVLVYTELHSANQILTTGKVYQKHVTSSTSFTFYIHSRQTVCLTTTLLWKTFAKSFQHLPCEDCKLKDWKFRNRKQILKHRERRERGGGGEIRRNMIKKLKERPWLVSCKKLEAKCE